MKRGSRLLVGFHRLGVVLAAPFLIGAVLLAVLQWQNPSGPVTMVMPDGTLSWVVGDDPAGKQLLDEQRRAGFNVPDGMMVVGLPLGNVRYENAVWTKFQLFDGREIGIASTDLKRSREIAKQFLLEEKSNHQFTDKDEPITIDGVRVTYLDPFDQFRPEEPPWLHKQRDWTWSLVALCIGFVAYAVVRAIGWVFDGFLGSSPQV